MADVKSIYDLILSGQPGGGYSGIYKPSPPVMMPPQGMGASVSDPTGDRQTWSQFDDQASNQGYDLSQDRLPSGPAAYGSGSGIDPMMAYAMGSPGANQGTGPAMGSDAQKAIGTILANGGALPPGPRRDPRGYAPLSWETAKAAPAPEGDPWGQLRIGQLGQSKGMVTANRPSRGLGAVGNPAIFSQPTKPAISHYQAALQQAAQKYNTTPEAIHQQIVKPITYSATPVAAGNFSQGSPNQSFEKDNGVGSVTNSMAKSSRWNTGY